MQLINGKKIQEEILINVKRGVELLPFQPVFTDVLVGEDPASMQYVRMKAKMAESVGIKFHYASFPSSITTEDLVEEIKILNKVQNMCGIIIQLPLPETIDQRIVLDTIDARLDVDCLGRDAGTLFYNGKTDLGLPAALACIKILDSLNLDLMRKNIVVLGQGDLVGKPVTAILRFRGLHPVTINSQTENKEELLKKADIIISGVGRGKYITGDMIKQGAILIDAGASESNGSIVGDVDKESVKEVASFLSPVPGGVGPVTVAILLQNVLAVANKLK